MDKDVHQKLFGTLDKLMRNEDAQEVSTVHTRTHQTPDVLVVLLLLLLLLLYGKICVYVCVCVFVYVSGGMLQSHLRPRM